ncbi:hypothetical protein DFQ26_008565 [Actinomortierella ambigua]|nr:hypothetical protein DFQ26_008565 [Actinomortierella ambigua]
MTHQTDLQDKVVVPDLRETSMKLDHAEAPADITTTVESIDSQFGPPVFTVSPGQTLVNDLYSGLPLTSSPPSRSASSIAGDFHQQQINNNLLSSFSSTHSSSYSTTTSRRSSMQFSKPVEVKETLDASVTENAEGGRQLNQYALKEIIGRGAYGIVNLGVDVETGTQYAIKEFSKSKLRKKDKANLFKLGPRGRGRGRRPADAPAAPGSTGSPLDLIRGEIAILKKLNHINIVKLYEVLDDATDDSMYMVFEMCTKGILMNVSLSEEPQGAFSDAECRDVFQQMVLGIEYLHEHDIVHRDIKPDNLLRSEDGTVKIVDFGVSEMFDKGKDLTKKSAGSPAFMAPELCKHDHGEVSGKATDVWSMGVTLYCLRYGRLPFLSGNILDLQQMIRANEPDLSKEQDPAFTHFMKGLLAKDPADRLTIDDMRNDPWLTNNGMEPLITKEENIQNAVMELTDDDLRGAIRTIANLATVMKAITKFKRPTKRPSTHSRPDSGRFDDADGTGAKAKGDSVAATGGVSVSGTNPVVITTTPAATAALVANVDQGGLENISADHVRIVPPTPVDPTPIDMDKLTTLLEPATTAPATGAITVNVELNHKQEEKEEKVTATSSSSSDTEAALAHVTLEESGEMDITVATKEETKKVEEEEKQQQQQPEAEKEPAATEPEADPSHEGEGEGYMECNMETGMCYWVPAKKVVQEDHEEPSSSLPSSDDKKPEPAAAAPLETPSVEDTTVNTASTAASVEVVAPKPSTASTVSTILPSMSSTSESTPYEPSRTPSPSPYGSSSSPLRSGSSSPAFGSSTSSSSSSTPGKKSSVGKLSAARLAFFERKGQE